MSDCKCDFCHNIAEVDGKTKEGPWANMCLGCFGDHGIGLGTGRGQMLIKVEKSKRAKTRGKVRYIDGEAICKCGACGNRFIVEEDANRGYCACGALNIFKSLL